MDNDTPHTAPPAWHLAPLTLQAYDQALRYVWQPYATRNGLPATFYTPDARALTLDEVTAIFGAASRGTLRPKKPRKAPERYGQPYAVNTLLVLLSALRHAHHQAGLTWIGDTHPAHLRDLRTAYTIRHNARRTVAKRMTRTHVGEMFDALPADIDPAALRSSTARALSAQARLPIATAARITAVCVAIGEAVAQIQTGAGLIDVACIAQQVPYPLGAATCAHCLLATWKESATTDEPLLPKATRYKVRRYCRTLADALRAATFTDDVLSATDGPLSPTGLALVWSQHTVNWIRARAVLVPMRATGLRLDDIDQLTERNVVIRPGAVTIQMLRRHDTGEGTAFTYNASGKPLCPVAAITTYDNWVRAFLPHRRWFIVPTTGRTVRRPTDTHGDAESRALYQAIKIFIRQHTNPGEPTNPHTRTRLTPHSARRGFAPDAYENTDHTLPPTDRLAAVRRALGHTRDTTTQAYLDPSPDSERRLFDKLNDEKEAGR